MPYDPSALAIAKHLESLDVVRFVEYPGLESHPHHEVAVSQLARPDSGFGGVLSFGLDTDHDGHNRFASKLNVITSAVSLGMTNRRSCSSARMTSANTCVPV